MFPSNSNSNAYSQQHLPPDTASHSSSPDSNRENENNAEIQAGGNNNMEAPPSSSNAKNLKRRRYIRHTPQQKQQMEAFFLECPHPDDKQRKELGKLLGLNSMQIKFWFQNKRTQAKNQLERNENDNLRAENKELHRENENFKQILSNTKCRECGGLPPPEMAFEDQQMRAENDLLREEIEKVKRMMANLVIQPGTSNPNMSSEHDNMLGTSLNQGVGNVASQHSNMPGTLLDQGVSNVPSQDNNMTLSLLYQELGNLPSQDNNMPSSLLNQGLDNLSSQDINDMLLSWLNLGVSSLPSQDNDMPVGLVNQGLDNLAFQNNDMPSSLLNQGLDNLPSQDNNMPTSLANQGLNNLPSQDNGLLISVVNQGLDNLASQDNDMPLSLLNQGLDNLPSQDNGTLMSVVNQGLDNLASQDNDMPLSLLNQGLDNHLSQDNGMPPSLINQGLDNLPSQDNHLQLGLLNQGLHNVPSQDNDIPPGLLNQGLDNLSSQDNNLLMGLLNQGLDNLPSQDSNLPLSSLNQGVGHELSQHNYMPSSSLNQGVGDVPSYHNNMPSSFNQGVGNGSSQHNIPSGSLNQGVDNVPSQYNNMPSSSFSQEIGNMPSQHNNMPPSSLTQGNGDVSSQNNDMLLSFLTQGIDNMSSQDNSMLLILQGIDHMPSKHSNMPPSSLTQGISDVPSQNNDMLSSFLTQGIDNIPSQDNDMLLSVQGIGNVASQYNDMPSNSLYQGIDDIPSQHNSMPLSSINEGVGSHEAQPAGLVGEMNGGGSDPLRSSPPIPAENSDKPMIMELAVHSLEELTSMALAGQPLWVHGKYNADILNEHEYFRTSPRGIGPKPLGFKSESSRESMVVSMNHINLIEILMDVDQWSRVFFGIVSRAAVLEVVSKGLAGSYDGCMQVMSAEFQVPSPFVPPREYNFVRYCKQLPPDGSWAVVDVSLETIRPSATAFTSRRRPSGCLIETLPDGFSTKVTWVEHVEVDDRKLAPHTIYKPLVDSGHAFGAKRWMASLDRQCERIACTLATNIPPERLSVTTREGRKGLLKLAERMVMSFFSGLGASTAQAWTTLTSAGCHNNIRIITRKGKDEPGMPSGIVIGAATSFRLAIPSQRAFDCIRSANFRNEWDVLAIEGNAEEFAHIENGRDPANCVSLFRVKSSNPMHSNLVILQESITDSAGSFVVYAPIDVVSFNKLVGGKPPDTLPMLPAGFAILPDVGTIAAAGSGGCLVTVAFQILIETDITKRISLCSVSAVNTLVKNTVERIKAVVMSNRT